MATKAIKFSNDTTTYLPVTDATLVQMKVGNETKSVQEVILEDEEVTAAGYNELNNRVIALEGADMSDYITQEDLSSNSYITTYLSFVKITSGANSSAYTGITPNTNSPIADSKNDELTINGGNYWIKTAGDTTNDKITIGHAIASNTATTGSMNVNLGGSFTTYSYTFDEAGHRKGSHISTVTIVKPSTSTAVKSGISLTNNNSIKYVELVSNAPELDTTWLSTHVGTGSNSYFASSCSTTALGISYSTVTAYITP